MSDIVVPSWRPSQEKPAISGRMLAVAGGLLGLAALGTAAAWGISRMGPRPVPVIEADPRPLKVRPEAPGGMVVPNQDQLVLEGAAQRRAADRNRSTAAQLDTGPEAPALDLLRQQSAPRRASPAPAAPVAPPEAAPAAAASGATSSLGGATLPPPAPVANAAVTAPAAAVPGPVAGGRSYAQFGALNSEEAARAEWDRLVRRVPELSAFQPRITRLDREGQTPLWRLRAAGLADPAAARALCEAVRARGVSACVPSGGGNATVPAAPSDEGETAVVGAVAAATGVGAAPAGAGGATCRRSRSKAGASGPESSWATVVRPRSATRRWVAPSSTSWSWLGTTMPPGDSGRTFSGRGSASITGTGRGPMREIPQAAAAPRATSPSRPPATASIRPETAGFSWLGRQDGTTMSLTASPRQAPPPSPPSRSGSPPPWPRPGPASPASLPAHPPE